MQPKPRRLKWINVAQRLPEEKDFIDVYVEDLANQSNVNFEKKEMDQQNGGRHFSFIKRESLTQYIGEKMVKLKMLAFHKTEDVPDHIIEEMQRFATDLTMTIKKQIENVPSNVVLSGLNWVHTAMLKELVTEDAEELRKAAKMCCVSILNNMEILIEKMEKNEN